MATIFYSWQSDINAKINRSFIRDALENAIRELSARLRLSDLPSIDEDTSGRSGSPEIVSAVLDKIDSASMFVADLTLTGTGRKKVPNPNVLMEYGYALKALGSERILAVMNEAFGRPESLPFDIRSRRCSVLYYLKGNADREGRMHQKRSLITNLREALETAANNGILQLQSVYETRGPLIF